MAESYQNFSFFNNVSTKNSERILFVVQVWLKDNYLSESTTTTFENLTKVVEDIKKPKIVSSRSEFDKYHKELQRLKKDWNLTTNWLPFEDDIICNIPTDPDEYFKDVLYGDHKKTRLSAFTKFCR